MSKEKSTLDLLREKKKLKPSKELLEMVKKQAKIKTAILGALRKGPKTIPEISNETGLPTYEVIWYLMTYRKYGEVKELEAEDDYFRYEISNR